MTSKMNPRLKRKNEFSDKNIEPNLKALKKDDIIAHYTSLLAKYSILEQKNIVLEKERLTHIEAIRLLEETVNVLEKKTNPNNVVDKQAVAELGQTQVQLEVVNDVVVKVRS